MIPERHELPPVPGRPRSRGLGPGWGVALPVYGNSACLAQTLARQKKKTCDLV